LVQECRRAWARQGQEHSYAELTQLAATATPLRSIIDPDHASFAKPNEDAGDMPDRILAFCRATNQPQPTSKGEIIRCALEGLALKYRRVIENVESVLGHRLDPIHMVGGGTQNQLQCQFTADATNRPVIAGPVEATTIGNLIMQMMALGQIASLSEGRDLIRRSFDVKTYEPASQRTAWDEAYGQLLKIIK
jgi:rhamnulokinase